MSQEVSRDRQRPTRPPSSACIQDAHNAILDFDEKTSLFAVYDGHGGAEIALYCSRYLPEFLKKIDSYREGRFEDALKEGFLQFDSLLLESNVKKVLQKLANADNDDEDDAQAHDTVLPSNSTSEDHHNDEFNRQEAQLLKQEAELPIEELLKRYNGQEERADSSTTNADESGEAEKKAISVNDPEQHEAKETTTSETHPDSTVRPDVSLSLFDLLFSVTKGSETILIRS